MNNLLKSMARATVNEAIHLAVAELKAEAIEASATEPTHSSTENGTIQRAVEILVGLTNTSKVVEQCNESFQRDSHDLEGKNDNDSFDVEEFLGDAVTVSREVLNNAVEKMTLTANTGVSCISFQFIYCQNYEPILWVNLAYSIAKQIQQMSSCLFTVIS